MSVRCQVQSGDVAPWITLVTALLHFCLCSRVRQVPIHSQRQYRGRSAKEVLCCP